MIEVESLTRIETTLRPLAFVGSDGEIASAAAEWAQHGMTVRTVRGRKMRTIPRLFDEFAAALQFPAYFGENRDAFDECLADLEGLALGAGLVIVVLQPDQLLADEAEGELFWFVQSLTSAARAWSSAIERGEWWDRPAVPFHVVLAGDAGQVSSALRSWELT